jgi:hypothetical protein
LTAAPNKLTKDKSSADYFGFLLSEAFQSFSTLIYIYTLFLPERQMGEAWEPPNSNAL